MLPLITFDNLEVISIVSLLIIKSLEHFRNLLKTSEQLLSTTYNKWNSHKRFYHIKRVTRQVQKWAPMSLHTFISITNFGTWTSTMAPLHFSKILGNKPSVLIHMLIPFFETYMVIPLFHDMLRAWDETLVLPWINSLITLAVNLNPVWITLFLFDVYWWCLLIIITWWCM
jgi:hypothetical protein